jgi:hypothetical protein
MPTESALELLIPISMFLAIVLVVWIVVAFRFKTQQNIQATYRAAIERGQELTPELLDRLGESRPKNRDLRRGIVLVGLGLGLAVFGLALGEEDAVRPLIAVGALPLLVGVAYLGLWKFTAKDQ